jgi:hypothetical protein
MFASHLIECLFRRKCAAMSDISQPLKYAFLCICPSGNIKQTLIPFGILYNGGCLPVHRQHNWAFGLLQLLHEVTRCPAKRRE